MNNELFRDLESMTIGLDDTFKFHCDQCGKCCTHREDIILSPMDIFKMAKELKMTPVEFNHEYCVFNIGEHTRMPIVRLASEGKDTHCVLLKNHRCSVHKSYLALSKILHSDMRDFFQTDFGKEYYQKWLKEHGKVKPKHTQYDYEDDEDE